MKFAATSNICSIKFIHSWGTPSSPSSEPLKTWNRQHGSTWNHLTEAASPNRGMTPILFLHRLPRRTSITYRMQSRIRRFYSISERRGQKRKGDLGHEVSVLTGRLGWVYLSQIWGDDQWLHCTWKVQPRICKWGGLELQEEPIFGTKEKDNMNISTEMLLWAPALFYSPICNPNVMAEDASLKS